MPASARFEVTEENLAKEPVKLVRFSHGRVKSGATEKISWSVYKKKSAPAKKIMTASVNAMDYSGQNFGPESVHSTDTFDYYVAVRSKDSNKVKVLPAEIYRMNPVFEGEKEPDEFNDTQTWREQNAALAKDFGSGKSQRAIRQHENNKLDQDMVASTTRKVAERSQAQSLSDNGVDSPDTQEVSAIPPHDASAKTPGEVYKLKDIIKEDLMSSLATQSEVFVKSTKEDIERWRSVKTYPGFILDKLETLAMREEARLFQSQCLMYLHCLMHLHGLKFADLRKKYPLPVDWPEPVKKHLLATFTFEVKAANGRMSRCLPGRLKDLLLSHILVLCLKLTACVLPLGQLMVDLNMAQKKLCTHATALGCTVRSTRPSQDKSSPPVHTAELKVPFKLPEMRGKSNKKRIF